MNRSELLMSGQRTMSSNTSGVQLVMPLSLFLSSSPGQRERCRVSEVPMLKLVRETRQSLDAQNVRISCPQLPTDINLNPPLLAYISNRRLLLSLADAGGRLMYAYKDLLELAGLTTRLYTLLSTLLNLKKGYIPLPIEGAPEIRLANLNVRVPRGRTDPGKALEDQEKAEGQSEKSSSSGDDDAPLVRDLNLAIKAGEHLMITGSNGVGKTAVARVLGGLWDPAGDEPLVEMPRDAKETSDFFAKGRLVDSSLERPRPTLYVLPQRSYMTVGSLLEQIIYPCSFASFAKYAEAVAPLQPPPSGSRLNLPIIPRDHPVLVEIYDILEKVFLAYVVEREGGLAVRKEWRDVLSGGEKQRMGMARVLWWRPRFAVLDGKLPLIILVRI